jgi:pectate lyase
MVLNILQVNNKIAVIDFLVSTYKDFVAVQNLHLEKCGALLDSGLKAIAKNGIKHIWTDNCSQVTDTGVKYVKGSLH